MLPFIFSSICFNFLFYRVVSQSTQVRDIIIDKPIIKSVILENNERLSIKGEGMAVYLQIAPHFYFGELLMEAVHTDQTISLQPKYGSRYEFIDSNINLTFLHGRAGCKITVYAINLVNKSTYNYHLRGIKKAKFCNTNIKYDAKASYFFDFDANTRFNYIINNNSTKIEALYMNNDEIQSKLITGNSEEQIKSGLFILKIDAGDLFNSSMTFSNGLPYGDWTDVDSKFTCWPKAKCDRESPEIYLKLVQTDRSVAWWIWSLIFGVIGCAAIILIYFMFEDQSIGYNNGINEKPLISFSSQNQ